MIIYTLVGWMRVANLHGTRGGQKSTDAYIQSRPDNCCEKVKAQGSELAKLFV